MGEFVTARAASATRPIPVNESQLHESPPRSGPSEPDSELLRRFAGNRDQTAFGEFVRRHLDLVYSTALRGLAGDAHLAHDVVQSVFTDAARKADRLAGHALPSAWLHASTRFAAAKAVRTEQRRRRRDGQALAMHDAVNPNCHDEEWASMRPVIDQVVGELRSEDRDAIVLRFFEAQSFASIGRRLRLTENAARMRVDRALDRLRSRLTERGITSTSAALASVLAANAVVAAPAGLAGAVTSTAVAATGGAGGLALFSMIASHKISVGVAAASLALTGVGVQYEHARQSALEHRSASAALHTEEQARLEKENDALRARAAEAERIRQAAAELPQLRSDADYLQERLAANDAQARAAGAAVATKRAAGTKVLDPKQLDRLPKAISQVKPKYPQELARAGIEGRAVVEFVVGADGSVSNVKVLETSHQSVADASVAAVQQWKFQPGTQAGQAASVKMQVPMIFSVNRDTNWF
ncbi:hypothetical protein DB347_00800 [Opitutaceae bacterium EW11]|nr:hypothetical protein DB347_00800 [Opitutaceae bacterium EW11]